MAWARLFVRSLARAGVTDAVLSPGSRSAPLAVALAEEPALRLHVVLDERAAAFFALGQARVTDRPSLLVCTSGTAGAHYFPAVIEAAQSFVPMLVVTADRPWELYDAAAPQTIDQVKLFGDFARHYAELGLPDPAASALRGVPRIAAQAVARSRGPLPGPVHVNARFRKPLEPVHVSEREAWEPLVDELLAAPGPAVTVAPRGIDSRVVMEVADRVRRAERGIVACGPAPLRQARGRDAILELARRAGFPLVAEATSQVRFGGERHGVIEAGPFDAILRAPELAAPGLVLQLGAPPTSGAYADLAARSSTQRVVVAEHGWNDPQGTAALLVEAEPAPFAEALAKELGTSMRASAWATAASAAGKRAEASVAAVGDGESLFEGDVARLLFASAPNDALLVAGNSTPVRDLDLTCAPSGKSVRVAHQRGASGIDGLVAGAAGAATVDGSPTTLLVGDLSLAHDLSSLGLAARVKTPLVIVVVQNGGGRIFDQLPIARAISEEVFERCFGTAQEISFALAAGAYGIPHARVETGEALEAALAEAWARPGATLIEAIVEPRARARRIQRLWAAFEEGGRELRGRS